MVQKQINPHIPTASILALLNTSFVKVNKVNIKVKNERNIHGTFSEVSLCNIMGYFESIKTSHDFRKTKYS